MLHLCERFERRTAHALGGGIGRSQLGMAFLEQTLGGAVTVHHGHMPEIELTSPTTATGIWALQDVILWPDGGRMHGYGHYHETYERIDGQWRIRSSTLTRLHMELTGFDT